MRREVMICLLIIIIIVTGIIDRGSCKINEAIHFNLKTVPQVTLESEFATAFIFFFNKAEERQKLCFYAKMRAELAYIDYNYVPEWQNYVRDSSTSSSSSSSISEKFLWGMYCATLPTIYLLRGNRAFDVQITFLDSSSIDQYSFDKKIIEANSVSPPTTLEKDYLESREAEEAEFVKLSIEDRRNLCLRARDNVLLDFLNKDVLEVQRFEFELAEGNEKYVTVAIPCPTTPQLYLCRGNSGKQMKLILLKDLINQYEFELDDMKPVSVTPLTGEGQSWNQYLKNTLIGGDETTLSRLNQKNKTSLTRLDHGDRKNLCNIARKYRASLTVPYVEDVDVLEAQLYSFQYPGQQQKRSVAILCSALPRMYLHSDESEASGTRIKITFVQNLADHCVYSVEVPKEPLQKDMGKLDESEIRRLRRHPFTTLNQEDIWNFCFSAQKYILSDEGNCWNFCFSEQEPTIFTNKLLLIPAYMDVMRMYGMKFYNNLRESDIFIKCSEWPQLYLRQGKSANEIIAVLNKDDLIETQDVQTSVTKRSA